MIVLLLRTPFVDDFDMNIAISMVMFRPTTESGNLGDDGVVDDDFDLAGDLMFVCFDLMLQVLSLIEYN